MISSRSRPAARDPNGGRDVEHGSSLSAAECERWTLLARIEEHIRRHGLIPPGGEVACLVSGGADSTCLWHALAELGYRVSAVHVNHGLRGAESEEDAAFCRERARRGGDRRHRLARTEAELFASCATR